MKTFLLKFLFLFLVFTLICVTAKADNAYRIKKGESSPIDGVVITEKLAIELYKSDKSVPILKQIVQDERKLKELYRERSNESDNKVFWYRVGLGIISGALIYRGITR